MDILWIPILLWEKINSLENFRGAMDNFIVITNLYAKALWIKRHNKQ